MQGLLVLTLFFYTSNVFGFTLVGSNNPPRFSSAEITVRINSADCVNIGETASSLKTFLEEAFDEYWNSVETSSIELKVGDSIDIGTNNPTLNQIFAAADDSIVISCSQDSDTFSEGSSTLAVGGLASSGSTRGYVAINDRSDSPFQTQSDMDKKATVAHEVGHALGIGHSEKNYALMYYQTGAVYNSLSEDDKDAISYLYPAEKELGGLLGACGSIALTSEDDQWPNGPGMMLFNICLGILLGFLLFLRKKRAIHRPSIN